MFKYILIASSLFLISCCRLHTEVKYSYNEVTVLRIDECGKTSFYYESKKNYSAGKIWVEYNGINDGFDGYLKFENKDKVTVFAGNGTFKCSNLDTTIFQMKEFEIWESPKNDKAVYFISLSTRYENEDNIKYKSKVKAKYNIDDNEWW